MNKLFYFKFFLFFSFVFFQSYSSETSNLNHKKLKVLVLIIASDNYPVYVELQKIWRSYMHNNPDQIETYFIKGDPNLENDFEFRGDEIWSRTAESLFAGVTNKTLLSLEAIMPRLHEFDYVLRTNLSSFYYFPNLLKFLETRPKTNYYGGGFCYYNGGEYACGCGFLMSPDIIPILVQNKTLFLDKHECCDDVLLGHFLIQKAGIKLDAYFNRVDIYSMADFDNQKDTIPHDAYHFRVKNNIHELRLTDDIFIHKWLLKKYYQI